MKALAAALGVLAAACVTPACAGGYWDAGGPPAVATSDPPPCPSGPPVAWRSPGPERGQTHVWRRLYEAGDRDVVVPSEFFEGDGGVGPAFDDDGWWVSDAGVIVESDAFASATATARADVRIGIRAGHPHHHARGPHCACHGRR